MAGVNPAEEILAELEELRIRVEPRGQCLELVGPKGALPAKLAQEIRRRRTEIVELVCLRGWPKDSKESVRRFGRPEARLYPFLGKRVATPLGQGRLLQVFAERAAVALDNDPRRLTYLLPSEVRPLELAGQVDDLFEAIH